MAFKPLSVWRTERPASDDSTLGVVAVVAAVSMWSAGNIIVKALDMPGAQIAFWRITLSGVAYYAVLRASGRRLTVSHLKASAPAALAIAIEIALFFVAIKHTTVANTTVLAALQPLVLLAVVSRFGERVTRALVTNIVVAVAGVALVVYGSSGVAAWSPRGDILAFTALAFFSAYFFFAKQGRASVPAFEFQTAIWLIGSVTLLPVALIDAGGLVPPTLDQWKGLATLALVPGTGHLLMNWAHPRVQLSLSSTLTLLIPILSVIGAAIFLEEPVTAWQMAGMAVVLVALGVAIRRNAASAD